MADDTKAMAASLKAFGTFFRVLGILGALGLAVQAIGDTARAIVYLVAAVALGVQVFWMATVSDALRTLLTREAPVARVGTASLDDVTLRRLEGEKAANLQRSKESDRTYRRVMLIVLALVIVGAVVWFLFGNR